MLNKYKMKNIDFSMFGSFWAPIDKNLDIFIPPSQSFLYEEAEK